MGANEEIKKGILATLKANWKPAVVSQYEQDPDKVKNADISKNAKEIMNNPTVGLVCRQNDITTEDIEQVLTEIKDEVIAEFEE